MIILGLINDWNGGIGWADGFFKRRVFVVFIRNTAWFDLTIMWGGLWQFGGFETWKSELYGIAQMFTEVVRR